jgi:hypothetical protein
MNKLYFTLLIIIVSINTIEAQKKISISNFSANDISDSELLITVDYSYSGETDSKEIFLQANPVMIDGRYIYKEVVVDHLPIESGDHQVSIKISKKPGGKDFNSASIRVCMTASRSILLCEVFAFTKSWNDVVNSAKINSFVSNKNQVKKGDFVILTWETEHASTVRLGKAGTADFHKVPSFGSETVSIDKSSTYVLMVSQKSTKGPAEVESKKIKISVTNNEPVIGNFHASRPTIRRGVASKLMWNVFGADHVTLDGESVSAIDDKIVTPNRTTNYILKAQTGDKIIEETLSIYVTPFALPNLSPPIYSLELCRRIDVNGGYSRCISSDGPFATGDKIYLIARFKNLPPGKYMVKRTTYNGFYNSDKWSKTHQEESSFENPGKGEGVLTFPIVNLGEGAKKLKITLNDEQNTSSEIIYCIDCSRMWE